MFGLSGKQSRAMLVIESLKRLKDGKPVSEEEFFRASVMGWCIQWVTIFVFFVFTFSLKQNGSKTIRIPILLIVFR